MGKKPTEWQINVIYQEDTKESQEILLKALKEFYLTQPNKRKGVHTE